MIELRILGKADLRSDGRAPARDLLAQPRPTALLVYMAIAEPGEFHRRDHLVTLFWPESDQEHARGNLRQLVYTLRRTLGSAVVEVRGDEELRLNASEVWCDAAEFDECARGDRLSRAIELYRGPLLPGFVLAGAPAFQDWLDAARRRLSRQAVKAALTLATHHARNRERTAAGDLAEFVRRLESELDDEYQLRKLITLLEEMGDRSNALGLYEGFRQRLWKEYGATPSPETRALIDRIKAS